MKQKAAASSLGEEPAEGTADGASNNKVSMARKNIHQSFVSVCARVENVKRDTPGQVGNQKYKYATLESVLAMTQPLLEQFDLALTQFVVGDALEAHLVHAGGETMPMGSYNLGPFVDQQKRGSAISYGRRYQLCSIFGITQEDDDAKSASEPAKVGRVFKKSQLRTDWYKNTESLLRNASSLTELRGIWRAEHAILEALKNGDDNEQGTYEGIEKIKDQAKEALTEVAKQHGGLQY